MNIIFIYGLPGVGKLTVGRELAKQTNLKLFHNHMVINLITDIFGNNTQPVVALREGIWLDFFKYAVTSHAEGFIVTFCFDKYLSKDFLKKMEEIITPHGSIQYVELTCNYETLQKRIEQPSRKLLHKLQDFNKLMREVEDKSFYIPALDRDVLHINNTLLSPQEAAEQIMHTTRFFQHTQVV